MISIAAVLAWVVAALLAVAEWVVVATNRDRAAVVTKPLATLGIGVAGGVTGLLDRPWGVVALLALAFGVVGDVMLLDDAPQRFLAGLAAFLGNHLLYLAAFVMVGLFWSGWLVPIVLALIGCLVAARRLLPELWAEDGAAMAAPVAAYQIVIAAMALAGAATGRPLVAIGAGLFLISDTVLASNRFLRPVPRADLIVMVTYLLAQGLIVAGLCLR